MSTRERNHKRGGKTERTASEKRKPKPSSSPKDSQPTKSSRQLLQQTMPEVFPFTSTPKPTPSGEEKDDHNLEDTDREQSESGRNTILYPSTLFNFIDEVSVDVLTTKLSSALMLPQLQEKFQKAFMEVAKSIITSTLDEVIQPMKKEITSLKEELKKTTDELHKKTDELEQYSLRNSLRITGVEESENEDIQKVTLGVLKKINKDISITDFDRCHQLGRKVQGRKRQIIVKFVSHLDKDGMYTNRRKLGNKMENVYINEDLTQYRRMLFMMARDLKKSRWIENTWTRDGRIFVLEQPEGAVRHVQCKDNLNRYVHA